VRHTTCDCGRQQRGSGVVVEILLYRVVMPEALPVKPHLDGLRQHKHELLNLFGGWRRYPHPSRWGVIGARDEDPIQQQHVEVDVERQGRPESLNHDDGA
jgi:hypothetical protein